MTDKTLLQKLEKILALTSRTHQPEVDGDIRGWEPVAAHRVEVIARVARAAIAHATAPTEVTSEEEERCLHCDHCGGYFHKSQGHRLPTNGIFLCDPCYSYLAGEMYGPDPRDRDRGAAESERLDNLSREQ